MAASKELSGKIYKGATTWRYESTYYGSTYCHDFTKEVTRIAYACPPSWGGKVVDNGALRMAVCMLMLAHCAAFVVPYDYPYDLGRICSIARKHYKQFAKEVVAKLPDSWSMSKAEVLDWIEKQERKRRRKK